MPLAQKDLTSNRKNCNVRTDRVTAMSSRAQYKNTLRREMRQRRRSMSFAAQRLAAKELARRVIRLQGLAHAHRIGAYLATDGEIDPLPTLIELMRRNRLCLLPVMVPGRRPRIRFASFNLNSRLIANRFKINEPAVPRQTWLDARELDIILVPWVAFDAQGNRLGRGGAFYDASLASMRHRCHLKRPRLIGLAHECQRVERLDTDSWDIPLEGVLTDQRFLRAKG